MRHPRAPCESTLGLLRHGYAFISRQCDALGTDLFTSRALLRPVTFLRGPEAARVFYADGRFSRSGAMPTSVLHLLQDEGSVQSLEDDAHRCRKAMFLSLMTPAANARLGDLFTQEWEQAWDRVRPGQRVILHDLARVVLTRTACRWSGIPLERVDLPRLSGDLGRMIDETGSVGPGNWNARRRRRHTEDWAAGLVESVRSGELDPADGTALATFARGASGDGERLDPRVAAVELINILRPVVAVARFIVFSQVALARHPSWAEQFRDGNREDLEPFVQEVRRFFPFFPAVPGTARQDFTWRGHRFREGDWAILDLYGTDHDARRWEHPEAFRPERFRDWSWDEDPYGMIAQGAGEHPQTHRCPGEWGTVEIMERAVQLLAIADAELPAQDLTIRLDRIPALPRDRVVLVRRSPRPGA